MRTNETDNSGIVSLDIEKDLFVDLDGQSFLIESYRELEAQLLCYLDNQAIEQIRRAVRYGALAHRLQVRESGEPYFTHPIAVTKILASHRFELPVLLAGLLHDVLEDTDITINQMQQEFGTEVTSLVDGVSKLKRMGDQASQEVVAESFKKMFLAISDDFRVVIIKLADRLHNMQTLSALKPHKRKYKSLETLDVYASIAEKLGMFSFRILLEELVFKNLYPKRYQVLKKHYQNLTDKNQVIKIFEQELTNQLNEIGVKARIKWRKRHLWGIYQRMKRKQSFAAACKTWPLRVITDSEDDCYRILGKIHKLYRPIKNKFKDYIAEPKSNGYRSLHTSVLMDEKEVLNIQIRTSAMNQLAENGILAMLYNHERQQLQSDYCGVGAEKHLRDWIFRLKQVETVTTNPIDFYHAIKKELISGDIHVYTPKGEIVDLPSNATAIDFAYAIHTEIGNCCQSVLVNGAYYPLNKPLETGQTVEIITNPNCFPSEKWLDFVQSAKARVAILYYFRHQSKE